MQYDLVISGAYFQSRRLMKIITFAQGVYCFKVLKEGQGLRYNDIFLWLKLNYGQHLKPNFSYHFSSLKNLIAYKSPMASRVTENLWHGISGVNFLLIHEQMDRF